MFLTTNFHGCHGFGVAFLTQRHRGTEAQSCGGRHAAIIFYQRRPRDWSPYQRAAVRDRGRSPFRPAYLARMRPPYLPCAAKRLPCVPWLKTRPLSPEGAISNALRPLRICERHKPNSGNFIQSEIVTTPLRRRPDTRRPSESATFSNETSFHDSGQPIKNFVSPLTS